MTFTDKLPDNLYSESILISGAESLHFDKQEYLIIIQNNDERCYEIRYEYHCSPFKQAMIIDSVLAVGYEENFYLFDLVTNRNLLNLKMEWYFGHLYFDNDLFYVADACGLYCINKNACILWQNSKLAIDGVVINDFSENVISGSGEWDPPGGWKDFIVDKQTGITIKLLDK